MNIYCVNNYWSDDDDEMSELVHMFATEQLALKFISDAKRANAEYDVLLAEKVEECRKIIEDWLWGFPQFPTSGMIAVAEIKKITRVMDLCEEYRRKAIRFLNDVSWMLNSTNLAQRFKQTIGDYKTNPDWLPPFPEFPDNLPRPEYYGYQFRIEPLQVIEE